MSVSVGIVGLPNAGKSTLFNALLKRQQAKTGKHPFTTIEPNKGVVSVPDERLSEIATLAKIKKQTPAVIEFVDIAGLVAGANQGEGLGNQFLAHIREVDVILHVVRGFTDPTVSHVHSSIDPLEDLEIVNTELMLSDLNMIEKAVCSHKDDQKLVNFLKKIQTALNKGTAISQLSFTYEEKEYFLRFPLLSAKPQVIVFNVDEKDINKPKSNFGGIEVLYTCALLEEELAPLPWVERQQYLKAFNLPEPILEIIIKKCFQQLNLIVFYTIAKGNEARAWPVPAGTTMHEAAGRVHTDFAKKFIKAMVCSYADFITEGSWEKAKEVGKMRLEGKEAFVSDGDIIEFKIGM